MSDRLDTPRRARTRFTLPTPRVERSDRFGKIAEAIARFVGTPRFLVYMTIFCVAWLGWNSLGPEHLRFDSRALGFTALTLMLSLPMLGISLLVGVIVGIVQAATQIHEATLTFVPKILAFFLVLALLGPWMLQNMMEFTTRLFTSLPALAH